MDYPITSQNVMAVRKMAHTALNMAIRSIYFELLAEEKIRNAHGADEKDHISTLDERNELDHELEARARDEEHGFGAVGQTVKTRLRNETIDAQMTIMARSPLVLFHT